MGFSTLCHDDNDITQISFPRSVFLTDKKNKLLAINFTVPRCRGAGVAGQCPGAVEVQQAEAAVALVGEVEAVLRIVALRLALTEVVHGLGVDKDPLDELIEMVRITQVVQNLGRKLNCQLACYNGVVTHLTHAVEVAAVALNTSGVPRDAVRARGWVQAGAGVVVDAVLVHSVVRPGLVEGGRKKFTVIGNLVLTKKEEGFEIKAQSCLSVGHYLAEGALLA